MYDLTPNFDDAPMWSLNMSNTNVIGLNSFTNVTALDPNQLPMWPPWTSFTKVTKIDFSFLPICPTWLLPMCPRWDCLKIFTNMSAPPFTYWSSHTGWRGNLFRQKENDRAQFKKPRRVSIRHKCSWEWQTHLVLWYTRANVVPEAYLPRHMSSPMYSCANQHMRELRDEHDRQGRGGLMEKRSVCTGGGGRGYAEKRSRLSLRGKRRRLALSRGCGGGVTR